MKIYEVVGKSIIQTIKTIKSKPPSKTTIKPIKPKPPSTPEQTRIQSLKQQVERAKENVKREREAQKRRRGQ